MTSVVSNTPDLAHWQSAFAKVSSSFTWQFHRLKLNCFHYWVPLSSANVYRLSRRVERYLIDYRRYKIRKLRVMAWKAILFGSRILLFFISCTPAARRYVDNNLHPIVFLFILRYLVLTFSWIMPGLSLQ